MGRLLDEITSLVVALEKEKVGRRREGSKEVI